MMIMKKLRIPALVSADEFCCASSTVFRVLRYSTKSLTLNHDATTSPAATDTTLYDKLVESHEPSVFQVLDHWVREGRDIDQEDLHNIIKKLREFGCYKHALQICQWVNDNPNLEVSHIDVSLTLDLLSKVYGLKQAEEYFNELPKNLRGHGVHCVLLNCYARAKSLEKAEATMQKIRKLGISTPLCYNVMMNLYSATEKYEKLDPLIEEMEQKGIHPDSFTYGIRLNAYVKTSEIEKMEKLLLKMEADPEVEMSSRVYTTIANEYLKAGESEKALSSLKKSESFLQLCERKQAYEYLLTLYASIGRKDEVYRVWDLYKNLGEFCNHGYCCLLSSLAMLNCIDEVEKTYEEWEAEHTCFDFQVPNFLITFYFRKGLIKKAETLVKKLIESGKELNASTWSRMTFGYVSNGVMDKAVEALRRTILGSFPGWRVPTTDLYICLNYLNQKGRSNEAKEIMKLLQEKGHLSAVAYMDILRELSEQTVYR